MVHLILLSGKNATHGIEGRKGRRGFLRFVYKEASHRIQLQTGYLLRSPEGAHTTNEY